MKMSAWSLTCQQIVFKSYNSSKHFWEFYPQDGGENQLAQIRNEVTSLSPYVGLRAASVESVCESVRSPHSHLCNKLSQLVICCHYVVRRRVVYTWKHAE